MDATGFKIIYASHYYAAMTKLKSKYTKLSIKVDVLPTIHIER